ncbi:MAG: DNA polymerase III subunit beta [Planctomycetia bacterium]|nr:DNA polymerase III subunit beta [Planctomycetia bacterium]
MRLTCDREQMLHAFQAASAVAPARSPKPILQNVKLDARPDGGVIVATDLEVGIRVEVPGVESESAGSVVLPIGRFGSILRETADAKLQLETDGHGVVVRGERSEFRLPAENPAEFPAVSEFAEAKYHSLPARVLGQIIRRTSFATDNESSRYALGGVLIEMTDDKVTAVGTDGRRLAMMEAPAQSVGGHATGDAMTIVPTRSMHLIEKILTDPDGEVHIAARANEILVKTSGATLHSRLVEGRFPKWRDVFPKRPDSVRIELTVGPLYSAVRQAAIVTSEESRGVDFTFGQGKLVLAGKAPELGQSRVEMPVAYDGAAVSITLDPRFFSDFLKVLEPESTFALELKDAESAAVCQTGDGYAYVIMPLARDR